MMNTKLFAGFVLLIHSKWRIIGQVGISSANSGKSRIWLVVRVKPIQDCSASVVSQRKNAVHQQPANLFLSNSF